MKERLIALLVGVLLGAGALVAVGQGGAAGSQKNPADLVADLRIAELSWRIYYQKGGDEREGNARPKDHIGAALSAIAASPQATEAYIQLVLANEEQRKAANPTPSAPQASQMAMETMVSLQKVQVAMQAREVALLEKRAAEK